MEIRILGPVEIRRGTGVGVPARRMARVLLGVLALRANTAVSVDWIVDALWDGRPPRSAAANLRSYLADLRRLVDHNGPDGVRIDSGSGGRLVLRIDTPALDTLRFYRLVAEGRGSLSDGRHAAAAQELTQALGLWRGSVLDGLEMPDALQPDMRVLEDARLDALEDCIDARLALAQHTELAAELGALVTRHTLRERLWRQLMLALYRTGRQADALAAYLHLRAVLDDELGVSPTPTTQHLHQQILTADPALHLPTHPAGHNLEAGRAAGRTGPAQLPPAVASFVGRAEQLHALDTVLADDPTTTAVAISTITGTAGVGKTALAVHWAHRVADRFPDGQLYVNLRGFDPGGRIMQPAAAVRGFLEGLGVPAERIPTTLDAQVGLYRSLLAGKRLLVVLDNARDADHARPLLPGTPTAVAVVTSRSQLTPLLATDGAHPITLDLPTPDEARDLLARRLGPARVTAEPQAVEQIITACARLPLALAIAAARAQQSTFPLALLAAELTDASRRLDALDAGNPTTQVRAVFSWSYTTLTPPAARLFRLLGLHPGPDSAAPAAASLAGLPLPQTRRLLTELTRAGLLGEQAPGRYGFHDLLRDYATHLIHTVDTDQHREAATVRLLDHYTHTAHTTNRHLRPAREPIQVPLTPPAHGTIPEPLPDQQSALAWLDAELPVLLASQQVAAVSGRDTHAWQLAWALDTLLNRRGRWPELAGTWQTALPAADRLPHPAAAYTHRLLGAAMTMLGDDEQAHTHLHHALHLHTNAADPTGQAHTHRALSILWERRGRPERALGHAQQALTLFQATGHRSGQAHALNAIGWDHALLGDHTSALTYCQQALTLHQEAGNRDGQAATWDSLGYAHHHLGHHTHAADSYTHAHTLYRDLGDHYNEADTLTRLGDTHHAAGQTHQARTAWTAALDILTDLDHPDTDTIRAKLARLDQQPAPSAATGAE